MLLKHILKPDVFFKDRAKFKLIIIVISALVFTFTGCSQIDPLNEDERKWIEKNSGEIVMSNGRDWPPVFFRDSRGKPMGIAVDYSKLIEKKLGFKFSIDKTAKGTNINKKINLINAIETTEKTSKSIIHTDPYIDLPIVIVTRRNISQQLKPHDLKNKKILMYKSCSFIEKIKSKHPDIRITPAADVEKCIIGVTNYDAYAAITSLASATYIIEKNKITNLKIAGYTGHTYRLRFSVNKENLILKRVLDKGLNLITNSERKKIYGKWFFPELSPFYKKKGFWIIMGSLALCLASIQILIITWNYRLKKAVKLKTKALENQKIQLETGSLKRQQLVEKLLEKETHLKSLLQTIPDVVWLKNTEGRYLNCNPNLEELYGKSLKEITGKTDYDLVDRKTADFFRKGDMKSLESESIVIIEESIAYPGAASEEIFETIKTPMYDFNQKIVGILGISRNITKRKKVEKELLEKNALLESILSNIHGITYRCLPNKDWDMIYLSSHIKIITGYEPDDFIDNSILSYASIIHPGDRESVFNIVNKSIRDSVPWEMEYRIITKYKGICWVFEKGSAILNSNGDVEYLDGFIIDINDKKIMEERFMQSQKMEAIGALSGGIAHDFNNILSGIMGFTELLQQELKSSENNEKMLKWIEYIMKGGIRARELVSQILAFSRHEKQMEKPVSIPSLSKEISKLLRSTLPPNISIIEQYYSSSLVVGNPTRLYQILMNLCTNAGYAMKDTGGKLTINIKDLYLDQKEIGENPNPTPGKFICISIEDTGVGMDQKTLEKIMTPFFTTKPSGSGTGIGLWVVQGIVDKMKGIMKVSSEPLKGSLFRVYLPAHEPRPVEQETRKKRQTELRDGRIMFIDDEASLLHLARISLGQLGYSVATFKNGDQAVKEYEKNHGAYDIIITDMNMPEISGKELALKIRKVNPDAKIILSTGTEIDDENYLKLFDSFLYKPFEINEISKEIEEVMKING